MVALHDEGYRVGLSYLMFAFLIFVSVCFKDMGAFGIGGNIDIDTDTMKAIRKNYRMK
ncbi:MAG: hypothetical protein HY920_07030 [Elusimicrobia bacterium]|nr:hypothetical protein [Elusimicrobiota bacterium]